MMVEQSWVEVEHGVEVGHMKERLVVVEALADNLLVPDVLQSYYQSILLSTYLMKFTFVF